MWNNVVVFTLFVMLLQIDNIITFVLELLKRVGDLKSQHNNSIHTLLNTNLGGIFRGSF